MTHPVNDLEHLRLIDQLCDEFENEWLDGRRPSMADYLARYPSAERSKLFRFLLVLDIDLRRRHQQPARCHDYQQELPEYADVIESVFDDLCSAQNPGQTIAQDAKASPPDDPSRRYVVERLLGEGGFGSVFLATDTMLGRKVAIKISHRDSTSEWQLLEARVAANLKHPNIVSVYDIGRGEDDRIYIVSEFISGRDLKAALRDYRRRPRDAARLIASIAKALEYAHQREIIHRDVKPANILIDQQQTPYLTDFGLALRESERGSGPDFLGTLRYMSPEQARRESHLVDGRSDLFSLCVVLYELTTGQRPFDGRARAEILDAILYAKPKPPSAINPDIPTELERIVLKGLAKRAGDRYQTGGELAEDLLADWHVPGVSEAEVVPKGLRCFEASDASFFLRLVPGPQTKDGIPASVAFWETRIGSRVADKTFRVGVLYGPSGSGKSSFLQAGLLPRLRRNETVLACFVKATPDRTERDWREVIQAECVSLDSKLGLVDAMRALRGGQGVPVGTKLLVVLDQFEQWLSVPSDFENTQLVQALRQCDGVHTQALLAVRDDFWYSLSRCLRAADVDLDATNSRPAEPFDHEHACKVLLDFGRAYGRVDKITSVRYAENVAFANAVLEQMRSAGEIVPVQLALFAQQFRQRPWNPAELQTAGGVDRVFAAFLDSMLAGPERNPVLSARRHEVINLLRALLPPPGKDIKTSPRSAAELDQLAALGNTAVTAELLRMLETEYYLVSSSEPSDGGVEASEPRYQLAHDYLVRVVRQWTGRQVPRTALERADNLLSARSRAYQADPRPRNLPSLLEWLWLLAMTKPARRTPDAQIVMRAARRHYALRLACLAAMFCVFVAIVVHFSRTAWVHEQVVSLTNSATDSIHNSVHQLSTRTSYAVPALREALHQLPAERTASTVRQELHLRLALMHWEPQRHWQPILQLLGVTRPAAELVTPAINIQTVAPFLEERRQEVLDEISPLLDQVDRTSSEATLRMASLIAQLDPLQLDRPPRLSRVVDCLVSAPAHELAMWLDQLRPAAGQLAVLLPRRFGTDLSELQQDNLARMMAAYATRATDLVDAMEQARPGQLSRLMSVVRRFGDAGDQEIKGRLDALWQKPAPQLAKADLNRLPDLAAYDGSLWSDGAFALAVPIDRATEVIDSLRPHLHPVSFRPYRVGQDRREIRVAIAWNVGDRDYRIGSRLSRETLEGRQQQWLDAGFAVSDVSWYLDESDSPRFAALALAEKEQGAERDRVRLHIDETKEQRQTTEAANKLEYRRVRFFARQDPQGNWLFSSLWVKAPDALCLFYFGWEGRFSEDVWPEYLQYDCQFSFHERQPGQTHAFYQGVWGNGTDAESVMLLDLLPEDHRRRVAELRSPGIDAQPPPWRPRSLSVRQAPNGLLKVCAVWYRSIDEPQQTVARASRAANLAIARTPWDTAELEKILSDGRDRQTRSSVLERLRPAGYSASDLERFLVRHEPHSDRYLRNLLLALGNYPRTQNQATLAAVKSMAGHPDAAIASAARWVHTQWELPWQPPRQSGNWYLNELNQMMIVLSPSQPEIEIGSPSWELDRDAKEIGQTRQFEAPVFSLAATETTGAQFRLCMQDQRVSEQYRRGYPPRFDAEFMSNAEAPQIRVHRFDAMRYCNWLSRYSGLPASEWCYIEDPESGELIPADNIMQRTGYRLPTEAEWEYACRAGSRHARHYGPASDIVWQYAVGERNSNGKAQPVASLKPNEWGFFDMLGNVYEWCHDRYVDAATKSEDPPLATLRGGAFGAESRELRSARRFGQQSTTRNPQIGFRVARTEPTPP